MCCYSMIKPIQNSQRSCTGHHFISILFSETVVFLQNVHVHVVCACSQNSEGPCGLFLKSPRNFFGPAKPLLVNLYPKTESYIHLKLIV